MPFTPVTDLPTPPSRTDPTNFAVRADAFLAALPQFQTELNDLATYLETEVPDLAAAAAESFADEAEGFKDQAQASAQSSGNILFYDTYADASAALGGLSENQVVEVYTDETRDNRRTRYRVESSTLVFKIYFFGEVDTSSFSYLTQNKSEAYWVEHNLIKNKTIPNVQPTISLDFVDTSKSEEKGVDVSSVTSRFKNKIINGNFDIWQRATSQTSSGYGSDDRWVNSHVGSSKTHTRESFDDILGVGQELVPGNPKYFSRTVVTSSAGSSNYVFKLQRVEDVRTFAGKKVNLSFYAKADATKNISIEFAQSFGTGGSPSTLVTGIGVNKITLNDEFVKYNITVEIPSINGKTIGTNGDSHLALVFWFDAGSDFDSRTGSLGQQSGTFDIAKVQLEDGEVSTEFEERHISEELLLCQRYYRAVTLNGTTATNQFAVVFADISPYMRRVPTVDAGTLNIETIGVPSGQSVNGTGGTNLGTVRVEFSYNTTGDRGYPCGSLGSLEAEL